MQKNERWVEDHASKPLFLDIAAVEMKSPTSRQRDKQVRRVHIRPCCILRKSTFHRACMKSEDKTNEETTIGMYRFIFSVTVPMRQSTLGCIPTAIMRRNSSASPFISLYLAALFGPLIATSSVCLLEPLARSSPA